MADNIKKIIDDRRKKEYFRRYKKMRKHRKTFFYYNDDNFPSKETNYEIERLYRLFFTPGELKKIF